MKQRHPAPFCLLGTVFLILVQTGCQHAEHGRNAHALLKEALLEDIRHGNPHRLVTIAYSGAPPPAPGLPNPCEVDYPVTFLNQRKNHTIAWGGSDHAYWVQFYSATPPIGTTTSPIGSKTIPVPNGSPTSDYTITVSPTSETYFTYSIYDVDPDANPGAKPCKNWDDDRDTGVNVKP